MLKRLLTVVISVTLLSACSALQTRQDANPAYCEHHYMSHDLDVVWNATQTGPVVRLKGTVANPRYNTNYEYFELRVSLLDQSGRVIGENTFATAPGDFMGTEAMQLSIPVQTNEPVCRIKFFYTYGIGEDRFFGHFKSVV